MKAGQIMLRVTGKSLPAQQHLNRQEKKLALPWKVTMNGLGEVLGEDVMEMSTQLKMRGKRK